ncbi:MAG: TIGR02281 family clan AA aspartic protease [Shinella sp.]|jgi:aspartyl protease family protein|nr:TIGR02281 family clan AA aspartic protease [Shinella sp.]
MLVRSLVFAAGIAVAAVYAPDFIGPYLSGPAEVEPVTPEEAAPRQTAVSAARYTGNRGAVLEADAGGHFSGTFTINGRKETGLVDTGASMVAINVSTAERLGIARKDLSFRYAVDTANGKVSAAYVKLDSVEIGPVRVRNVGAMVLEDRALSGTLIGMSFLKGLSSYQVEGSRMRLIR